MQAIDDVIETLPVLGVGASLSFGVQPDPVDLALEPRGPAFIEYAGAVQHDWMAASINKLQRHQVPLLYHPSCLNLCGPFANTRPWVEAVARHVAATHSAWLAQDVAICFASKTPGYSIQLGYFIPPILTAASLDEATTRVQEVTALLEVPLLLEPAPVTFVLGDMPALEWLNALSERTGCGLLLDAGHLVSHQLAARGELLAGLEALDLSRVVELHIAGGVIEPAQDGSPPIYIDAHDLPILPETWQVARAVLERAPNLKAVCVECEGTAAQTVLGMLQAARERVAVATCNPALAAKVEEELAP